MSSPRNNPSQPTHPRPAVDAEPENFRRYRAPRRHGEVFVEPEWSETPQTLQHNVRLLERGPEFVRQIRDRARTSLLAAARQHTEAYRSTSWFDSRTSDKLIMGGHQPTLFHPGVWFKNFVISDLAAATDSIAVNLVIDNDVCRMPGVRVPSVDPASGQIRSQPVLYDDPTNSVPYEQSVVSNVDRFESFDRNVTAAVRGICSQPMVTELWNHARSAVERCDVAGCALSQSRHSLEETFGLRSLEVPISVVSRSAEFARFVVAILERLSDFRDCYNHAAREYRRAHHIRSTAHPVPDLAADDDWIETPLWVFGEQSPARRPMWVKPTSERSVVVSDRGSRSVELDLGDPQTATRQLAERTSTDFKIRPRALLTTIYARLVLCDLFVHGIGGAKYDQLGDILIREFFGTEPPRFMVVSATVLLPTVQPNETDKLRRRVAQLKLKLRQCEYQPERFADRVVMDPSLLTRKRHLLGNPPPRGERKAWHDEITHINVKLSAALESVRERLWLELADTSDKLTSAAVLESREHPFCVFPRDYLARTYESLLRDVGVDLEGTR